MGVRRRAAVSQLPEWVWQAVAGGQAAEGRTPAARRAQLGAATPRMCTQHFLVHSSAPRAPRCVDRVTPPPATQLTASPLLVALRRPAANPSTPADAAAGPPAGPAAPPAKLVVDDAEGCVNL